jgi:hypothetical protein
LSQAFQASRDIHSIPEDVVVFDNDVSHMDADTKFDAPVRWDLGIPFGHAVLHFGRTTQGVDDARELDQQAVAGGLDEATLVLGDLWIEKIAAQRFEAFERAFLVRARTHDIHENPML